MQEFVGVTVVDYLTCGDVEKLREMLENVGIEIKKGETSENHTRFTIKFDTAAFKKKMGRSAGRHEKYAFESLTLQEYKRRIAAGETAAMIADSLGLSRATLYRRVKAAKREPGSDDSLKHVTW